MQQFTISQYRTKVAVISFDEALFGAGSFALTRATNFTDLRSVIYALPYANRASTVLGLAEYVIYVVCLNEVYIYCRSVAYLRTSVLTFSQGHAFGSAAAVIYLVSTP